MNRKKNSHYFSKSEQKISELEQQLRKEEKNRQELDKSKRQLEAEIAQLKDRIRDLEMQVDELTAQNKRKDEELAALHDRFVLSSFFFFSILFSHTFTMGDCPECYFLFFLLLALFQQSF